MQFTPTEIVNTGAGIVALVLVFWLVYYWTTSIGPQMKCTNELLTSMKSENQLNTEVIKNNTDAITAMSQSNTNIASALRILEATFETHVRIMEKHDARSEQIQKDVIEIKAKVDGGYRNGNH